MQTSFFLGANSKSGFFSRYDALIDETTARAVYIIKGSPGCGKSSFMRRIMKAAVEAGFDAEEIRCSSDPGSLDGVVLPALGVALVDGTAPHVVEPKFPLAVERYIDLSAFADADALYEKKDAVIDTFLHYRSYYTRAYRLTACAASLANEMFDIALGGVSVEKLRKKAAGVISRELKGAAPGGSSTPRFLSAISPAGYVDLFDTVKTLAERVFLLEDSYGLASFLLHPFLDAAVKTGHEAIACYSPLIPERLEHVLIPSLSLAFVTTNKRNPYPYEYYRRMRIDAMIDPEVLRARKQKLVFSRKLYAAMLEETCATLAEAKDIHDDLEHLYNPYIDFEKVYALADRTAEEILARVPQK